MTNTNRLKTLKLSNNDNQALTFEAIAECLCGNIQATSTFQYYLLCHAT